jgi:Protein of unknown function with PCYCGC motif
MRSALHALTTALVAALICAGCSNPPPPGPAPAEPLPAPPPKAESAPVPPFLQNINPGLPLPQVLSADAFRDTPGIAQVYRAAGRIRVVLAQQPCYCHCDRMGHGNLLDCFATDHGAG